MQLAPLAQGIALSWWFYFDHLGTELGQDRRCVRTRDQGSEFEYPDACQRAWG